MAYLRGVDTAAQNVSSAGTRAGSITFTALVNNILVANNGSVIKLDSIIDAFSSHYAILQGAEFIQAGFQHDNTFRILEPDADPASEHYYYDNSGTYPWVP